MCLAVPMKILELTDTMGACELEGTRYDVDLTLIESPLVGDYVIVHAGFAIEKLDQDEAAARLDLFEQMAKAQQDKSES